MRDDVFKTPIKKQFEFDEKVASVFDDMISRSVPYYALSVDLTCEFLARTLLQGAKIADFGCSTGALLLKLHEIRPDFSLIGIDDAPHMLNIARTKANAYGAKIEFRCENLLECDFKGVDCAIMNYTLQFLRPLLRPGFVRKIYDNLAENGVFILSEKLLFEDATMNKNIIEIYENYKFRQGYTKFEIAQKRQALENVLIPFSETENKNMLLSAGFRRVESIFRWANFAVFVAMK